ncbi:M23 family metallopeptidase [Allobranchiibius huperziae]|uniref:Murein DD-endopeptidase MepM/ murein hydrolase activator NlpD n=1 Tax=Allobranchiibius huperziae TaxID=1874116 RepID=A0A853DBB0_9MICO|nr:M23 family metallopeptidase [Allobranchiibius huperziae]NYJ73887.1 murein DD-endopeptidase MepM/ murein hydrolase activator NlpD [Allobranchiibius huperziae]
MSIPVRIVRVLAGALVAISATTVSVRAYADDPGTAKKKTDARIKTTEADLDDIGVALVAAQAKLDSTTKAVAGARRQVSAKQSALTGAQNHSTIVAGELSAAQATEGKNTAAIKVTAAAQAHTTILVGGIARRSYEAGGLGNFALTLQILGSNGANGSDVADEASIADLLLRQQNGILTKLSSQRATQKAQGLTLAATRRRVAGLKIQADNAVIAATTARNEAQTAQTRLVALQRTQTLARNSLSKQKTVELANLKTQKAESARLGGILRLRAIALAKLQHRSSSTATARPATSAPRGNGYFTPPMPLSSIVSVFGMRVNPVLHVLMLHAGDDFPYACGTPVHAAAPGTVIEAATDSIAGGHIVIDHGFVDGQNLASEYEHLSRFVVTSGPVTRGQLIGYSGTTGRSTGCHLHFAVLDNGTYVNPMIWLQ